jgi:hypothetical protein
MWKKQKTIVHNQTIFKNRKLFSEAPDENSSNQDNSEPDHEDVIRVQTEQDV